MQQIQYVNYGEFVSYNRIKNYELFLKFMKYSCIQYYILSRYRLSIGQLPKRPGTFENKIFVALIRKRRTGDRSSTNNFTE